MPVGRDEGCRFVMTQANRECGYTDLQPIESEDQKAALKRELISKVVELKTLGQRIDALGI